MGHIVVQLPTTFPLGPFVLRTRVGPQLVLHLLKTLRQLSEATIYFQNLTNDLVNNKLRNLELNRRDVTGHIRTIRKSIP